jgi:3'-5' exoribonuclease
MVVEKLNLEFIEGMVDRTPIGGVCLLQTYSKAPTKNGGFYIGGTLSTSDGSIPFKAWGSSDCFRTLDETDLKGSIVVCDAEVNIYNGQRSLIVSSVRVLTDDMLTEMGLTQTDFMYSKYNVEAYWEKFDKAMEKNLSANAYEVFNTIMEKYSDRFKEEFAAMYHHDNCRGGLIAHSLKTVQIATIVSLYPNIMNWVSKDLLYLGCALHDIGKIVEYSLGDMSDEGKAVSHPVIGAVMLATEYADLITEKLGERFFYELISVVSSHHGDMGERPRTVAAYVVHKLDMIEALFTGLNEQLEDAKKGDVQQYDGYKLS